MQIAGMLNSTLNIFCHEQCTKREFPKRYITEQKPSKCNICFLNRMFIFRKTT